MKYKVEDRVLIKSLDWYNENTLIDTSGVFRTSIESLCLNKKRFMGKELTICSVLSNGYYLMEETGALRWTDEMIEGLVESIEDRMKELRKMCTISLTDSNYSDKVEVLLNDYEYIEENGKAYFVKKKKEYPKTYEECIGKLLINWDSKIEGYKCDLLTAFQKLLVCRDVYWKLYGDEMGLGKPWEPQEGVIYCYIPNAPHCIRLMFPFPTTELRDAFYENFKELIEQCKELL